MCRTFLFLLFIIVLIFNVLCIHALQSDEPSFLVWPPPKSIAIGQHNTPVSLHPEFKFVMASTTTTNGEGMNRLLRALARYNKIIQKDLSFSMISTTTSSMIRACFINVTAVEQILLDDATEYSYRLVVSSSGVTYIQSTTIYGAMYGMESFTQLYQQHSPTGRIVIPHDDIEINDTPTFTWRGLMIDSGRRFFPLPLVQNLLDTMAANKMSVLHLHASDHCRFGVESKAYPNLTASLVGVLGGYYTQQDVQTMIAYAADRGIRVMPEFDVPGHSRGFLPISYGPNGIKFCNPQDPTTSQLYGDPANVTYTILQKVFAEMSGLFSDKYFHIGCDETSAVGPCTVQSTFSLERQLMSYVQSNLQKIPAGWEEILFDAGAATQNTVVFSWSSHSPGEVTATHRYVVDNNASHFYFTDAAPGGPAGWSNVYYDITSNVPKSQYSLILGGEMSFWTDTYCYIEQCGAYNGPTPYAHSLFPPSQDDAFSKSAGGMIWPRGYVGAAAFWGYNKTVNPSDPNFVSAIWSLNDKLAARGLYVCPTNCSCDQLNACGKPY